MLMEHQNMIRKNYEDDVAGLISEPCKGLPSEEFLAELLQWPRVREA